MKRLKHVLESKLCRSLDFSIGDGIIFTVLFVVKRFRFGLVLL